MTVLRAASATLMLDGQPIGLAHNYAIGVVPELNCTFQMIDKSGLDRMLASLPPPRYDLTVGSRTYRNVAFRMFHGTAYRRGRRTIAYRRFIGDMPKRTPHRKRLKGVGK